MFKIIFKYYLFSSLLFINIHLTLAQDTLVFAKPKNEVNLKQFIIPSVLIGYGLVALNNPTLININNDVKQSFQKGNEGYKTSFDNYSQFAPAAAVFVLNVAGIKGKNNWKNAAIIFSTSMLISTAIVTPIKYITKEVRPDGSARNSFPSGHTATAFATAEFLRNEYWETSPWIGIAGYTVATASGILRMYNNKHWLSDVVAGAGVGIASTQLSYLIFDKVLKKYRWNFSFTPTYLDGRAGFAITSNF